MAGRFFTDKNKHLLSRWHKDKASWIL